jgi:hypothetical protein
MPEGGKSKRNLLKKGKKHYNSIDLSDQGNLFGLFVIPGGRLVKIYLAGNIFALVIFPIPDQFIPSCQPLFEMADLQNNSY